MSGTAVVSTLTPSQIYYPHTLTPSLQIQLLFELSSMEEKTGTISLNDFKRLLPQASQIERKAVAAPREPVEVGGRGGKEGRGCEERVRQV